MAVKLDEKDMAILSLVQENNKLTAKQISKKIDVPITTVFAKTKRMEELGVIKGHRAILAPEKLNASTASFLLASVSYREKTNDAPFSQRTVAKEIAKFPEVQEVHIITGDWDLLVKLRAESVDAVGKFVVDKLRLIEGLEKTLTCMVFETVKETTKINLPSKKRVDKWRTGRN
ncbi:AsnC family transcriptional regulator [miscellaneous Crenarchaeota group-1 archaeon SG8-32-3]|uniref:AsnC family transcriptional regulator n=1 Tax=miscellaneous Crenarchaeota group-1 archaeon SG8-32-3 TaxID=1685125 RepID=A0A0M0BRW7_9ARCH|nr:MAG: AsnC family transcriptional regulator [miscellaneous Crenarchaeota group-1 archaeon SG8-32-3]